MDELKPCPFCGGKARFLVNTTSARGTMRGWSFGIYCVGCNVTTPKTNYTVEVELSETGDIFIRSDERANAIRAWNRRFDNA